MDFFQRQDRAKLKTRFLVIGFFLSIIIIIFVLDLIIYLLQPDPQILRYLPYLNAVIFIIIVFGSLIKYFKLRNGGKSIADMLNAMPVLRSNQDFKLQQLINIVDEISIAAGIATPLLYVLRDEMGINAFVAGYNPNDTVLVVTQGALDNLSRDELQGVIAHEYSHIYNSDATLNLRLLIVLGGLLSVSQIGYVLIRTKNDRKGQVTMIGAILLAFGSIGLFFGNLIKAAISRQRETLADASAVQFTRNPGGIATALLKIQQQGKSALLRNNHAEEVSHMCFSKAQITSFFDVFATHPKLEDRIAALDPDGTIRAGYLSGDKPSKPLESKTPEVTKPQTAQPFMNNVVPAAMLMASIGNPTASSFSQAEALLGKIPEDLKAMLNLPTTAEALTYALLIARDSSIDVAALETTEEIKKYINKALSFVELQDSSFSLMLLDLAIPTLKQLSYERKEVLLKNIYVLISADNKLNLFEAAEFTMLRQRLRPDAYADNKPKYFKWHALKTEICAILGCLATHSSASPVTQQQAFVAGLSQLHANIDIKLTDVACNLPDVMLYLNKLRLMSPSLKQQFLQACVRCVSADGKVLPAEVELLRAICACLDCPMPV